VPIWLLGSSLFSAQLAAALGLPFAFASHFAPDYLLAALGEYRNNFQPSEALTTPYAMVGVSVVAAGTDAEAARLSTSLQQQIESTAGVPGPLSHRSIDGRTMVAGEKAGIEHVLAYAAVGSPETVRQRLKALIDLTNVTN
jgi:alkanesulfonate monooxygenase SsuD/methylene tetrahydromethanopterin reductase-like flavin-dependent oxidoreductase (luciferase family)